MATSIIAALLALAKALPQLAGLCQTLIDLLQKWEQKRNEVEAAQRKAAKDAFVREFIAAANRVDGVQSRQDGQQQTTNGEAGREGGSDGSTGVR